MKPEPIPGTHLYRCRFCRKRRTSARIVAPSEPFTVRMHGQTSRAFDAGTPVCNHHLLQSTRELDDAEATAFRTSCLTTIWERGIV